MITHNSTASACRFGAFAEVLYIQYVIDEAHSIHNAIVDANFVELGDNEYHVYVVDT